MNTVEFNQPVEQTVRELLPRIPAKYHSGFDGIFAGGEHWMAVEDLVFALADEAVSVTPQEHERLRLLTREAGVDDEVLAALDELTVSAEPREQ